MDPRQAGISHQFKKVKRVIAVSGCKGGIGKSMVSTNLALALASQGKKTGLLDLDFFSPSDHLILGTKGEFPEEKYGLIPQKINGAEFMSLVHFTEDRASPLRGQEVTDAILELLTITVWGELDFLIVDMPPGLGDSVLELLRVIPNLEFLLVTTSSKLAWTSTEKMALMLKEMNIPILGVLENMQFSPNNVVQENTEKHGLSYLGALVFEKELESALGEINALKSTKFHESLLKIAESRLLDG